MMRITHLAPDILECEVKWALGSITMNKGSGGDGISVELFQIQDFPGGSGGKASVYNVGDPCSVPGLGRSGEGNGHPLQYYCHGWRSLVGYSP